MDLWAVGSLGWSMGGAALREARWKHHKPCLQGTPVQVGKKLSTGQESDRSRWCQGLSVLGTGLSPAAPAAHLLRPPPAPHSFCSQDPKPLTSSGNISLGDSGSFCFCSGLGVSRFLLPAFESSEAKSKRRSIFAVTKSETGFQSTCRDRLEVFTLLCALQTGSQHLGRGR